MGAGKSTIGREVARRLDRAFHDTDTMIEEREGGIPELFANGGEDLFRDLESRILLELREAREPLVIALGGGAVETDAIREALTSMCTVYVEVDLETAWERTRGTDRPLATDEEEFRTRFELRQPLYYEIADAVAHDADDVILAAAGIHVGVGALERLAELVPGDGPVALVADAHVAGIHGMDAQLALGGRLVSTHEVSGKSDRKSVV